MLNNKHVPLRFHGAEFWPKDIRGECFFRAWYILPRVCRSCCGDATSDLGQEKYALNDRRQHMCIVFPDSFRKRASHAEKSRWPVCFMLFLIWKHGLNKTRVDQLTFSNMFGRICISGRYQDLLLGFYQVLVHMLFEIYKFKRRPRRNLIGKNVENPQFILWYRII